MCAAGDYPESDSRDDPPPAGSVQVAPVFDGGSGHVEIPDSDDFSASTRGALTVEAWIRPDTLAMPAAEATGYVHWLGKGEVGRHEWAARMYQAGNTEGRENRISFYCFNPGGGLGAGSYFQDALAPGGWIHVAGRIDAATTSIFCNGEQRDTDALAGYGIVPRHGAAPVRIGTRDLASFFQGAIGRVAIYGAALPYNILEDHFAAGGHDDYDALILGESSLVGYWPLDETAGTAARDVLGAHPGVYVGGVALGAALWDPA